MILLRRWYLLALAVASCGDTDDGGTDPTAAETTSDATTAPTTTDASTTASSTTDVSTDTSATTTESTTASTTASTTDTATGDTSATDDTGTTADTEGVACGDAACAADEVCLLPCCGGPPPGCFDTQKDGTCLGGGDPVPAKQCPTPCSTELCCPPEPCVPEPPHCEPTADLQCHESMCSIGECFGELQDGTVTCSCA